MAPALPGGSLDQLRRTLATLEPATAFPAGVEETVRPLGLPAVDGALRGGLARGALHELAPAAPGQLGAAVGFALAVAALSEARKPVLWIQSDFAALEAGAPYGPGIELLGLPMERLLVLRVPRPLDVLWAFEDALKSPVLAATLAELPEAGTAADLTATRRLSLAAREGCGIGLLLRHRSYALPTAAMTRWQIAGALSEPDRFGGLGRTAFDLTLNRNRRGPCGRWIVCWNHEERSFLPQTLSVGLAETARDRSTDARSLGQTG